MRDALVDAGIAEILANDPVVILKLMKLQDLQKVLYVTSCLIDAKEKV